jgi:hypothetical protein
MVARRWATAAVAGSIGGAAAGVVGGLTLYFAPTSATHVQSVVALAVIGILAGGAGGTGIGAGLIAAEVLARARRGVALMICGAAAGGAVAATAHLVLNTLLDGLFGLQLHYPAGAIDGLVLGACAGAGYGFATRQPPGGGLAAPTGFRRTAAVLIVAACSATGAALLALSGRLLVGGLVHEIARSSRDAELVLAPLGQLIGEPGFDTVTRVVLSAFEGGVFGAALTWGLTRRS